MVPIPNFVSLAGTNGHKLSGLNNRTLFSRGLGAGSPESGCQQGRGPSGTPRGEPFLALLMRVAGDAWRGAAALRPPPLRSRGPLPMSPRPCLSSSSHQDALLHVTSSQLASSATTLFPNKVTFTGTRVRTSAPLFGDTTQPRTQTCPSSPTPSVVSEQRAPHVGIALRLSPSFPGLPLLSVPPTHPLSHLVETLPHPSSLPGRPPGPQHRAPSLGQGAQEASQTETELRVPDASLAGPRPFSPLVSPASTSGELSSKGATPRPTPPAASAPLSMTCMPPRQQVQGPLRQREQGPPRYQLGGGCSRTSPDPKG